MVRVKTFIILAIGSLVIAGGFVVFAISEHSQAYAWLPMLLSSPAFVMGGQLPVANTCDAADVNPPLMVNNVPPDAESIVVDLVDPSTFTKHTMWVVWNLSPNNAVIPQKLAPGIGMVGMNDFGKIGYSGPCPAKGAHHYLYEVYALDTILDVPPASTDAQLQKAMKGYILGYGSLDVLYSRVSLNPPK